jgi:hypothetical protein
LSNSFCAGRRYLLSITTERSLDCKHSRHKVRELSNGPDWLPFHPSSASDPYVCAHHHSACSIISKYGTNEHHSYSQRAVGPGAGEVEKGKRKKHFSIGKKQKFQFGFILTLPQQSLALPGHYI